jgi:hypothetical protein
MRLAVDVGVGGVLMDLSSIGRGRSPTDVAQTGISSEPALAAVEARR